MFKKFIQNKLENYVRKYFAKHPEVKLVVVAGSIGKTSTKTNIATLLSERYRIRLHPGNHNNGVAAAVAILGIDLPDNLRSIGAWLQVFAAARKRIKDPTDVDVIVQELGIDRIGEMAEFERYLRPNIAVITAITPEHMEFLKDMETVASEELRAANFSELVLINRDDTDGKYATYLTNANINTYGTSGAAEFRFEIDDFTLENGYRGEIIVPGVADSWVADVKVLGEHSLRPVMGAVAVAVKLGLSRDEIIAGLTKIRAVPGRMNVLRGIENTTIIDDSYNSSPTAAESALRTLYDLQAPQRIAILGDMRELGDMSPAEHTKLGELCDPGLLAWVVTVGPESEKYLAPAARARGCQVKSFLSALDAGAFVHSVLETGAVVLAKGSQNTIFVEEAIKVILHETHEDHELVRQSPAWLQTKREFFSSFS